MNARQRHTCQPRVEALEDRQLLASNVVADGNYLWITGTKDRDYVSVSQQGSQIGVSFNGQSTQWFSTSRIRIGIVFHGYAGDDYFSHTTNLKCWATGGPGRDHLSGSQNSDSFWGDDGNDKLFGNGGNDQLVGGYGNDSLYGGYGSDTLFGEGGDDWLDHGGDSDRDWLYGGYGRDTWSKGRYDIVSDPDTRVQSVSAMAAGALSSSPQATALDSLNALAAATMKQKRLNTGSY